MTTLETKLLWTAVLIVAVLIATGIARFLIRRFSVLRSLDANRRKVVHNLQLLAIYGLALVFAAIIWGVKLEQFTVFISSVLAVVGVAFFAQWSILSNLTASVILFFNHPMRIGDRIRIIDSDNNWTGVVEDISGFYLFMKTDDGQSITIPTNLVLQKGIELQPKPAEELSEEPEQLESD